MQPLPELQEVSPSKIEQVRAGCAEHGEANAAEMLAKQELAELINAGFTDEEIWVHVEGTLLERHYNFYNFAEYLMDDAVAGTYARKIRSAFRAASTKQTRATALHLAEEVAHELDAKPSTSELSSMVMCVAMASSVAASQVEASGRHRLPLGLESNFVNSFTAALIERIDLSEMCSNNQAFEMAKNLDNPIYAAAVQMTELFNKYFVQSRSMNVEFMWGKVTKLLLYLADAKKIQQFVGDHTVEATSSEETVRELSTHNTDLAQRIQRLRAYDIKPIIFPMSGAFGDTVLVTHEYNDLLTIIGSNGQSGEQPLAYVQVCPAGIDLTAQIRSHMIDEPTEGEEGAPRRFHLLDTLLSLVVDRNGELYEGLGVDQGSLALRTFFEREGKLEQYETLRAEILSRLFDAVAPATIVDVLQEQAAPGETREATANKDRQASDVMYAMVLPRLRFLKRRSRDIKADFKAALDQEEAHEEKTKRRLRLHGVAGHKMRLPAGSRPGPLAALRAKECWGEDYELPEGYTFVQRHDRGDEALGRVVGHVAVPSAAAN